MAYSVRFVGGPADGVTLDVEKLHMTCEVVAAPDVTVRAFEEVAVLPPGPEGADAVRHTYVLISPGSYLWRGPTLSDIP